MQPAGRQFEPRRKESLRLGSNRNGQRCLLLEPNSVLYCGVRENKQWRKMKEREKKEIERRERERERERERKRDIFCDTFQPVWPGRCIAIEP